MEIRNPTLFFAGIIVTILGMLIVIFDYPQIQYFENMESESYMMLEGNDRDVHQRLKIEFGIGVGILLGGIALLSTGLFKSSRT